MPPPNPQKVAVTWIDLLSVLLLAVMGMGMWHLCEIRVREALRSEEPDEGEIQEHFEIPRLQREVTRAEEGWKAASKQLVEQRLERIRLAATIVTLPKTAEEHGRARDQYAITSKRIDRLSPYVRELESYLAGKEAALSRARRNAAEAWEKARDGFERRRKLITLGWSAGLAVALLAALWTPLSWERTLRPLASIQADMVLGTVAVVLAALFGYQAFGAPGLALASAALLFVLLVALLRRPSP